MENTDCIKDYIRKYTSTYPEDKVWVKGGYAAYLHINSHGVESTDSHEIILRDVDLSITTDRTFNEIVERWSSIFGNDKITKKVCHCDTGNPETKNGIATIELDSGLSFDIFVNDDDDIPEDDITIIEGINVTKLEIQIEDDERYLRSLEMDVDYLENKLSSTDGPMNFNASSNIDNDFQSDCDNSNRDKFNGSSFITEINISDSSTGVCLGGNTNNLRESHGSFNSISDFNISNDGIEKDRDAIIPFSFSLEENLARLRLNDLFRHYYTDIKDKESKIDPDVQACLDRIKVLEQPMEFDRASSLKQTKEKCQRLEIRLKLLIKLRDSRSPL